MTPDRLEHPPVLLFHSVGELSSTGDGAALFRRQVAYLKRNRYRTLTPDGFAHAIDEGTWHPKSVLLTFDDGYLDFYESAFPVLRDAGLTATVFLVSDILDNGIDAWRGPHPRSLPPLMGWEHVLAMRGHGIGFGSHSRSHVRFGGLDAGTLTAEAAGSKAALEERLGEEIVAFSYPYGDCDAAAMVGVERAGYSVAFAVSPTVSRRFGVFRRIVPPARTSLPLRLRASTAYPTLRAISHIVRGRA